MLKPAHNTFSTSEDIDYLKLNLCYARKPIFEVSIAQKHENDNLFEMCSLLFCISL